MSLRCLSRNCVQMGQQVMQKHVSKSVASFKASSSQPGVAAAKARQGEGQVMKKRSPASASAAARGGAPAEAAVWRRKAEKDENVMHLVCWGPN